MALLRTWMSVSQGNVGLFHGNHRLVQIFFATGVQLLHGLIGILLLAVGLRHQGCEDIAK